MSTLEHRRECYVVVTITTLVGAGEALQNLTYCHFQGFSLRHDVRGQRAAIQMLPPLS